MRTEDLKRPFKYTTIPIDGLRAKQEQDDSNRARNTGSTIKRIWSYLVREKMMLALVILMVILSSGTSLAGPFMVGMAIDDFIVTQDPAGLGILLGGLFVIYIFHSLAIFLQNYWMAGIAQNTVYSLREKLFHQFHRLPIAFFDKRQHGDLMSRITNDIDNISNTLNQSVIQIVTSILMLIGTVIVMLVLSPLLTAITMTIIPILFLAMRWITRRTGPLYKLQQQHLGNLNGYVEETVSGSHVVKTFSQENRVIADFKKYNEHLKHSGFWAQIFAGFIPKVMNMLNFLSFGLIALAGGILAIEDMITVGVIVIFTEYARQFTRPLNELSNQYNVLLSAVAGAERVFNIIDEQQEESDEQHAEEISQTDGCLVFDNVSFAYEQTPVLKGLSFTANPGQTVAFVGHTGAGKTTIINLISRFYEYDAGSITLDGTDLKDITRSSLRSHMAFVLQDAFLFHTTIRENIRYGNLDASNDAVIQAAKDANAHAFIKRLPRGYDTILDQDGSGVSQGQKQLITIARAIIRDPSILILDEATSNIDTVTELKIQEALQQLMRDRTSFVIAHRLNTIQGADKIVMLENGEIIEQGTHNSLIAERGHYYQLYKGQLKEDA